MKKSEWSLFFCTYSWLYNMRDSFLKFNLDKSYASIEFEIDRDIDFISINWQNNKEFFSFYLYSPDNMLYAQIIGISEKGTRIL